MSLICVNHLTFYYEGNYDMIFDDVSFQIDTSWKLGFIGRNGRGKTTFLKLLMGEYEYTGNIQSSVIFDYFPFQVGDKFRNTIEIVEEVDPNYEFWKVCRELTLLKMDCEVLYRPFNTLSNGEQTKVLLAVLFSKENEFLLIDEPTNHLDMETRMVVMEYLKKKSGFILVSHDRYFLDGCIDHVLAINKCNIEVVQGNFSSWWENKERQDAYEFAENERLKKDIKRLSKSAEQKAQWSDAVEKTKKGNKVAGLKPDRGHIGHMAAKMMKRSLATQHRAEAAVEEKKALLKNIEQAEDLKLMPLRHHKEVLISAKNLTINYGEKDIVKDLNFELRNGERLFLNGRNGCGKTSIIKAVLGENIPYTGELDVAAGLKISYISQDTSNLKGTLDEFAYENGVDARLLKTLLRKLDFSREQFDKRIENYSEGQKKKVLVAKSLVEQAHLYIWDEPLNFIDIFSRMQIENLVKTYQPTMLLVEHDRSFLVEDRRVDLHEK